MNEGLSQPNPKETKNSNENHVVISDGIKYGVDKLIEIGKSLEPTEMAISEFENAMETECWDDSTGRKLKPKEILEAMKDDNVEHPEWKDHMERIINSNTEYPILAVNIEGELVVLDGMHRLAKSFLENHASVLTIKFDSLPAEAQIK